jgi:membrane protein
VPGAPLLMQVIATLISFGFVTLLFAMLFKYLPETKVAWRDVWIGAAVTAVLFTLGKTGLEIYISKAAPESGYGAAGALALVLVWVYYSAQIFLMGAEFTAVYAAEEGSRADMKSSVQASVPAPDVAAAPPPVLSVPRPARPPLRAATASGNDLPGAVLDATVDRLPAFLGIGKGKKIKPLKFLGRLAGAAATLVTARLFGGKRKEKLPSPPQRVPRRF